MWHDEALPRLSRPGPWPGDRGAHLAPARHRRVARRRVARGGAAPRGGPPGGDVREGRSRGRSGRLERAGRRGARGAGRGGRGGAARPVRVGDRRDDLGRCGLGSARATGLDVGHRRARDGRSAHRAPRRAGRRAPDGIRHRRRRGGGPGAPRRRRAHGSRGRRRSCGPGGAARRGHRGVGQRSDAERQPVGAPPRVPRRFDRAQPGSHDRGLGPAQARCASRRRTRRTLSSAGQRAPARPGS